MVGAPTVKKTCLSGNIHHLDELDGLYCDGSHTHAMGHGKDEHGVLRTRRLQEYPAGLCAFLASCLVRTFASWLPLGQGPGGWRPTGPTPARAGKQP